MDPIYHFEGIRNQYPPHKTVMDPSRWTSMRLKGRTEDYRHTLSWNNYLNECVNLFYLELIDISDISLGPVNIPKLEGLFMKFKSVNHWRALINLSSSMKTIVVYASEGNDQECHTQPSKEYVNLLGLETPMYLTQFELW
jgi:hypothetical protein